MSLSDLRSCVISCGQIKASEVSRVVRWVLSKKRVLWVPKFASVVKITVKSERRVSEHRTSYLFKLIYIIRVVMDTEVVEFHIADRK